MLLPENLQKIYSVAHRKTKGKVLTDVAERVGLDDKTVQKKLTGKIGVTDDEYVAIDEVLNALPLSSQVAHSHAA